MQHEKQFYTNTILASTDPTGSGGANCVLYVRIFFIFCFKQLPSWSTRRVFYYQIVEKSGFSHFPWKEECGGSNPLYLTKNKNQMNTVQKGKSAEYLVISKLLEKGYKVFPSAAEDSFIDLLYIEPSNRIVRAQVKAFYSGSKGEYHFAVTKTHVNIKKYVKTKYTKEFVDVFIAVDLNKLEIYIIPIEFIDNYKSTISIKKIKENFKSL